LYIILIPLFFLLSLQYFQRTFLLFPLFLLGCKNNNFFIITKIFLNFFCLFFWLLKKSYRTLSFKFRIAKVNVFFYSANFPKTFF